MKIAIIEDDESWVRTLREYIVRYEQERGVSCRVVHFYSANTFLFSYEPVYDCVLIDINLPGLNGLEGAKWLRRLDQNVILIFVTNYAQFAVNGYEVDAADYLVKPFSFEVFSVSMDRVKKRVEQNQKESIIIRNRNETTAISLRSLVYIEHRKHRLWYHTDTSVIDVWGTMPAAEESLEQFGGFCRCSAGYLVNLRYVQAVDKDTVVVNGERLRISKAKKKQFMQALTKFFSNGGE